MSGIQRMIRCIVLRRSIATVKLPEREDLLCRLDFDAEEIDIYAKAESSTFHLLNKAIDGEGGQTSQLNVLAWINSLRMICNLGTRAQIPRLLSQDHQWNSRAAQEMFNGLEIAGAAACSICSIDTGAATAEAADQVIGLTSLPRISSCSHLICAGCIEKCGHDAYSCSHIPPHPTFPVSTFASELSVVESNLAGSGTVPTKIRALMQDLEQHIDDEKWYVC